jgi:hypothetical protein
MQVPGIRKLENGEHENILKIALTENNFFSQSARLFARNGY